MKRKLLSIILCLAMALSLLPTAALADEGETGTTGTTITTSEALVAAIANAQDGDTITLGEGEFTTYGKASPKKSLTFVGAGTGTVWTIGDLTQDYKDEKNGDYSFDGCDTITFQNMTLKSNGDDYRGFIRVNHTIVDNCTLNGKTAYWGYNTAKFQNGTIFNAPEGDYALWDYSSKSMTFDGCTFNISGKGVNVYVESGNASNEAKTVEVNSVTVNSTAANKAFLNIKNSTQAYEVEITGNNKVSGLNADTTTGSNLYQVETTTVTETSGKPVKIQEKAADGTLTTVYEVKAPAVAKVGGEEFTSLTEAFAALNETNHTLTLIDGSAWDAATPVYWKAGDQSEYAATLAAALTAAYKAGPSDGITIVCRPGADVGTMTHGHVADNLTIYGNNAYISGGECDLEVDTFKFSRATGAQANDGVTLDKEITITAYELDNLGVWGQRNTAHKVTINLTDCDGKAIAGKDNVQRVYISGTSGVNDITVIGCDFLTKATAVYSNADGSIVIDGCSFTGSAAPVNFNHKADGTQTVTVKNSTFTNCGDDNSWKQFAAPVRFVNSGNGTSTTTVDNCTFNSTVGSNGDILLGDGRTNEASNEVTLTVKNTAANVQAQKPGYYAANGTVTEAGNVSKTKVEKSAETTTITNKAEEFIVAQIGDNKYSTLAAAVAAANDGDTITLLKDVELTSTLNLAKNITIDGQGKYTIKAADSFTVGNDNKTYCVLYVSGKVTLKDVTVDGNEKCRVIFCDKGKLTIDGATITNGKAPNFIGGVYMTSSASFEMKSGSITGNKNAEQYQDDKYVQYSSDLWIGANANGALTAINGGTIGNVFVNANAWSASNPGSFTMNGGTVTNLYVEHDADYGATFKYNDGTIEHLYLSKENGNGQSIEVTPVKGVTYKGGVKEAELVTVTLEYNDSQTPSTTTLKVAKGSSITLPTPTRSGYTFNGWYDGSTKVSNPYKASTNVTLTAFWSYISSGSSSSDPTYAVSTPSKTENGTVTVSPKNASKGDTVTITVKPDSGYVLDDLTVTDKNGNELKLTDKGNGKYTFTMPSGRVEVKASFAKEVETSPFADVATDAYYYEAVKWAVKNGITTGVGNDLFAPGQPCTRAQIVTFLWRAAGSPEPKGTAAGMTDVVSGSYYEKAVAWAIENGVTTGTTATTFSPDATCTRAQAVTFLARALNAKATSAAEFSDVPTDSYFADAVAWAASNGVTEGVGNGLFAPDNDCTRGQIVTFLYRAYNK